MLKSNCKSAKSSTMHPEISFRYTLSLIQPLSLVYTLYRPPEGFNRSYKKSIYEDIGKTQSQLSSNGNFQGRNNFEAKRLPPCFSPNDLGRRERERQRTRWWEWPITEPICPCHPPQQPAPTSGLTISRTTLPPPSVYKARSPRKR